MISPEWTYARSVYFGKRHCMAYRDELLRVEKHVITKPAWFLFGPTRRTYYYIDGVTKSFRHEERMIEELWKMQEREEQERFSLIVHWGRKYGDL